MADDPNYTAVTPVEQNGNRSVASYDSDQLSPNYTGCCVIPCISLRYLQRFMKHRYYSIPFLIPLFLVGMIITCWRRAPELYRSRACFHISNLGNWQSGLSFFTVFMVGKAVLIYFLCRHVFKIRVEKLVSLRQNGQGCNFSASLCFFKLTKWCLPLGLIITGCFQQSWSKPLHNVGVFMIGLGVGFMFIAEICWYGHKLTHRKVLFLIIKGCMASIVIISFIFFVAYNELGKEQWRAGEADALVRLNQTECPSKYDIDSMLSGDEYPNYYPCKSKTFWNSGDPGWKYFCMSAVAEICMFTFVTLYPFTFWSYLNVRSNNFLPLWVTHMYKEYPTDRAMEMGNA